MTPTAQQLHNFASGFYLTDKRNPTVRECAQRFRCSQQDIRNVVESGDPIEAPGEGLDLIVAYGSGGGYYVIENQGSQLVEAY